MSVKASEKFEEWLDTYDDWVMYVGVNGLNHKAFAEEAWNHQQSKLDKANERIAELEKDVQSLEGFIRRMHRTNQQALESRIEKLREALDEIEQYPDNYNELNHIVNTAREALEADDKARGE